MGLNLVPSGQDGVTVTVTPGDPATVRWPSAAPAFVKVTASGGAARFSLRGNAAPDSSGVVVVPDGQTATVSTRVEATPITVRVATDSTVSVTVTGFRDVDTGVSTPYPVVTPPSSGVAKLSELTDVDKTGAAPGKVVTVSTTSGGTVTGWGLANPVTGGSGAVSSVAGKVGDVTLTKADVGLNNVNNTADANKPISSATQTALDGKAASNDVRLTDQREPSDASVTNAKVASNAAISLDKTADGSTNRVYTTAEKNKLAGVATGATMNTTAASIPDFTEAVQDAVAALLGSGSNVTLNYDDAANSLTISATGSGGTGLDAEQVRDTIGVALVGVGNIGVVVNDAADTITITTTATQNATDAALRDRDSHTDGTTYKGFTAAEKSKLAGLSALASSGRLADALDLTSTAAAVGKVVSVASLSPLQLAITDPPYAGDLPEYSNTAQTAAVSPVSAMLGKTTRHNTAGGTFTQPMPQALPGRVIAFGWDNGVTAATLAAASRTDTIATTSGSPTVTDPAIEATDQGRLVTGAGIPANTYVGTVTPGTSFLLSSSQTSQVNVNATATGTGVSVTVADVIGGGNSLTTSVMGLGDNIKLHCTFPGRWRFLDGFKSQSALDARYPVTDQASPTLGMVPTVTSLSPLRYGLATPAGGSGYTDEQAQDAAAALFTGGSHTGITAVYNDAANRVDLTVTGGTGSTDPEIVRDTIAAALSGTGLITVTANDAADTITISSAATQVRVDGSPVATFDVDSATPTPQDIGAQPVDQDLTDISVLNPANNDFLQRKAGAWTNRTVAQAKTDLTRAVTAAYAATVTPNADTTDVLNVGALTGALTLANPTGTPYDGQNVVVRFAQDSTGGRAITFGTGYAFGTDVTAAQIPTVASAKWEMLFTWHAGDAKWRARSIVRGF